MTSLTLGVTRSGKPFRLPAQAVAETFAIIGIRGAGKSTTAACMAEEMCKAGIPWVALDPVGVWYGMRSNVDGTPGGYPVVVIGGDHADVPLERDAGKQVANALMTEPVCAVIDLSRESKRFWHTFVTDFALELMRLSPEISRHLFIEEAPEFVPQRTKQDLTARCKEALERLIRLGRNQGYGCTLISQRPATVDKDVLSQMANLVVMRTVGPQDRRALKEWIEGQASEAGLEKVIRELAGLENGTGWVWSPHWLKLFEKVRFRQRETFHPGATRYHGKAVKPATMSDVKAVAGRLKDAMQKPSNDDDAPAKRGAKDKTYKFDPAGHAAVAAAITQHPAVADLAAARTQVRDLTAKLERVRKTLAPQYEAMKALFGELETGGSAVDRSVYEPWLAKAGRASERRMLEVVIERQEVSRGQLMTLSGCARSTYNSAIAWLKRNQLVTVEGDTIRLNKV